MLLGSFRALILPSCSFARRWTGQDRTGLLGGHFFSDHHRRCGLHAMYLFFFSGCLTHHHNAG